jgi:hypothetical protein
MSKQNLCNSRVTLIFFCKKSHFSKSILVKLGTSVPSVFPTKEFSMNINKLLVSEPSIEKINKVTRRYNQFKVNIQNLLC